MPALFGAYEPRVADATGAALLSRPRPFLAWRYSTDGKSLSIFPRSPGSPGTANKKGPLSPLLSRLTETIEESVLGCFAGFAGLRYMLHFLQVNDPCFVADLALPEDSFLSELGVEVSTSYLNFVTEMLGKR